MSADSAERLPADRERLAAVAAAFGARCRLRTATRLAGGSQRAAFEGGSAAVIYVWDDAENYWSAPPAGHGNDADPFSPASGLPLFQAAHARLRSLGIRVAQVYEPMLRIAEASTLRVLGSVDHPSRRSRIAD
jgi:hypothetical protein